MCPMAKAMVSTVRPNASDTPRRPIPTSGNAAASTALPQPPRTSQKVPRNSALSLDNMAHHLAVLHRRDGDHEARRCQHEAAAAPRGSHSLEPDASAEQDGERPACALGVDVLESLFDQPVDVGEAAHVAEFGLDH